MRKYEEMDKLKKQIAEARAKWLKNLISSDGYGGNDTLIYGVRMYLRALDDVEEMIHKIEGGEG